MDDVKQAQAEKDIATQGETVTPNVGVATAEPTEGANAGVETTDAAASNSTETGETV